MLQQCIEYIHRETLCSSNDKLLVAVSGGIDSVGMLHLLHAAGYKLVVAHCNFGLRGSESDGDEQFVRQLCNTMKIECVVKKFDTETFAIENKLSVQMAARELRYQWFERTARKHDCSYIAIAHNADDSIETFFINLLRGTGLQGLTGIQPRNGKVIRPILFATREQITQYCQQNNITWRNDSSNDTTDYTRNKLRLQILPLMAQIAPQYRNTMLQNMQRLSDVKTVFDRVVEEQKQQCRVSYYFPTVVACYDIAALLQLSPVTTYMHEFLHPYGFNQNVIIDIVNGLSRQSGAVYTSNTHRVVRDRDILMITTLPDKTTASYILPADTQQIDIPLTTSTHFRLQWTITNQRPHKLNINTIVADADALQFPLTIRPWQHGDFFYPLGLGKRKKLSDFFTDTKTPLVEKENTWLLLSGNDIVAVLGSRGDHRFRVSAQTKHFFIADWELIGV